MHLSRIFETVGWTLFPLLALSVMAVAVIIERWLAFRQFGTVDRRLAPRVLDLCLDARYGEAAELCEQGSGPLAASLGVVIAQRHCSTARIERLVEETGQSYFLRLERGLPILDTATTVAPLLGLLGTIFGMIGAFNAIAARSGTASTNNDAVLGGVAEALYATAFGILIAVVCFIAYNAFSAKLHHLVGETELAVTRLVNLLKDDEEDPVERALERADAI